MVYNVETDEFELPKTFKKYNLVSMKYQLETYTHY